MESVEWGNLMKKKVKGILSMILCFVFLQVSIFFLGNNKSYAQSNLTDREMLLFSDLAYQDLEEYGGKTFSELKDSTKREIEGKLKDPNKKASLNEIENWKVLKTLDDQTHNEIFATGLNVIAFQNRDTKDIVIAFRGSDRTIDWTKADLELALTGTNNQYKMAKMFTAGIILNNAESKIYLTGHSLGGFLAQEIAFDLHYKSLHKNLSFPDFIFEKVPFDVMAWLFNRENYESTKQTLKKVSDELSKLNYDENFKGATTFNGPGIIGGWEAVTDPVRYQLKKLYLNINKDHYNVTNYVINGDFVGGYSTHFGKKIILDKKLDLNAHVRSSLYPHFDKKVRIATKKDLANARYKTELKDKNGSNYNLYLIPLNEKQIKGSYSGNYGFVLQKVGSDLALWQEEDVSDFSFNKNFGVGNVEMVSVIKGKTKAKFDLLVLSEKSSVNENLLRLYIINDGKLIKMKIKGDSSDYSIVAANMPKLINLGIVQNVTYSNRMEDFGWKYKNYRIDMKSSLLIKEGQSILYNDENWDEGKLIYGRWIEDPDYFVQIKKM